MPRSAIATGLVDYVLPPADMPEQLLGYVSRAFGRAPQAAPRRGRRERRPLLEVLHLLRDRTGHDFSHYKTNTMRRRVERRMAVTRVESMDDYVALLQHDSREVETLFHELLIGVTSFFRDAAAFEALAAEALPELIAAHSPGDPVRVWVPGCSTGEEAYSIAMLLQEQACDAKRNVPAQVFATDIDDEAIERARAGVYPASISADVSPERLARFFVQDGDAYRVAKSVRDMPGLRRAGRHQGPALLARSTSSAAATCSSTWTPTLQQKLMPLFHYALNPGGYLFLGSSETVGDAADLFAPVDKKWKLFQRRGTVTPRQRLLDLDDAAARRRRRRRRGARALPHGASACASRPGRDARCSRSSPRRAWSSTARATCSTSTATPAATWSPRPASRAAASSRWRATACGSSCAGAAQAWPQTGAGAVRAPAASSQRRRSRRQPDRRAHARPERRQRLLLVRFEESRGAPAATRRRRAAGRRSSASPSSSASSRPPRR